MPNASAPPRVLMRVPNDIDDRAAIDELMVRFYGRAMTDPVIGRFFDELDLEHHLPVIGDFWDTVLLGAGNYARHGRHPLLVHAEIDRKRRLQPEHFQRWLVIFRETVDQAFAGPRAEFIKQRAQAIAARMLEFIATQE